MDTWLQKRGPERKTLQVQESRLLKKSENVRPETHTSYQDNLQVNAQGNKEESKHDNTTGATKRSFGEGAISCEERKN